MPGPHPAVAATRVAVRAELALLHAEHGPGALVLVACSGGADSLALAAALAFEAPRTAGGPGLRAGAVVVDHGLQPGSADAAERAAAQCRAVGLDPVTVCRAAVGAPSRAGGPEAAARAARYAELDRVAVATGAVAVLLGHTADDQAEQVLLGLARGSGTRSLAGIPPRRGRYARPLLGLTRAQTTAACSALGLAWWDDPTNEDPAYLRNRVRRALRELEDDLGPGLAAGLARSAELARDDADALDEWAGRVRAELGEGPWPLARLAPLATAPRAIRGRVWLLLAEEAGAGALASTHVAALDALVTAWRGQGPVWLPGAVVAERREGHVTFRREG